MQATKTKGKSTRNQQLNGKLDWRRKGRNVSQREVRQWRTAMTRWANQIAAVGKLRPREPAVPVGTADFLDLLDDEFTALSRKVRLLRDEFCAESEQLLRRAK